MSVLSKLLEEGSRAAFPEGSLEAESDFTRRRRRKKLLRRRIAVGVGIGLLTAMGIGIALTPPPDEGVSAETVDESSADPSAEPQPPPGVGEQDKRILPAPRRPKGAGGFAFTSLREHSTQPVTYDPCRPLHFVENRRGAPSGSHALLLQAVARMSAATGLKFVDDGSTAETADDDRSDYQPDRYGERWAPILIAWSTSNEAPTLEGDIVGYGWSDEWSGSDGDVYVSGEIVLDEVDLGIELTQPRGASYVRATMMHEWGHVLGLAHVEDPHQLMYADQSDDNLVLAAGDLRGLARLGSGACAPGF